MKVNFGPYRNWVGPYQIADFFLKPFVKDDDVRHNVGEWLSKTWVNDFLNFIDKKKNRKISVKIDSYDLWGLDHTLSLIIHPALLKLREVKHGSPNVDDADVPDHLRSTAAPPKENDYDIDDFHHARWNWVLDEMIWAFGEIKDQKWEEQFHSGNFDFKFEPVDKSGNPVEEKDAEFFEMKRGPKDTHVFDSVGYQKHLDRIQNGTKLFGTYFMALWD